MFQVPESASGGQGDGDDKHVLGTNVEERVGVRNGHDDTGWFAGSTGFARLLLQRGFGIGFLPNSPAYKKSPDLGDRGFLPTTRWMT